MIFRLLIVLLMMVNQAEAEENQRSCFPYAGEKMKFSVNWEFVNAGYADVNITAIGEDGYRIHNFAYTNSFFDMFRKVRDTLISEGVCHNGHMQSTLFEADQAEQTYAAKKHVEYWWQKDKVNYVKNGVPTIFDVQAGHLNVLDAFYLTRQNLPTKKNPLSIPLFDSADKYDVTVKFLKREMIKGPDNRLVKAVVVQPELKTEGVFTSVGIIKIWISDDERRVPLKIQAKIKIGHVIIRLIEYSKS